MAVTDPGLETKGEVGKRMSFFFWNEVVGTKNVFFFWSWVLASTTAQARDNYVGMSSAATKVWCGRLPRRRRTSLHDPTDDADRVKTG